MKLVNASGDVRVKERKRMTCKSALGATVLALFTAMPLQAATLDESTIPGGDFANSWSNPSVIGSGFDLITGKSRANNFDNIVFNALPAGAQTLTFSFAGPPGNRPSYAGGGTILYSTSPFRWGWDGTIAGNFGLFGTNATDSLVLNLGPSFAGTLYLAMNFTYGNNISYSISVPSNLPPPPPPSTVPLPASGGALAGGIVLAGLALRRKRSR